MANFTKLQKEAEALGIVLKKQGDSYWGQILQTRMELSGYADPEAVLEDLKAIQAMDAAQDLYEYDNDEDREDWYRVTYTPSKDIFVRESLAEAFADAQAHHTTTTAPTPSAPAPGRSGGRLKRGNGDVNVTQARQEAEDVPWDTAAPAKPTSAPAPFEPAKPEPAKFDSTPPKRFEPKTSGPIRSEDPTVGRAMQERTDANAIALALFSQLAHDFATLGANLQALLQNPAMELAPDPSDEEDTPPPPRRRSAAKRSSA